jgi:hypothetical protein
MNDSLEDELRPRIPSSLAETLASAGPRYRPLDGLSLEQRKARDRDREVERVAELVLDRVLAILSESTVGKCEKGGRTGEGDVPDRRRRGRPRTRPNLHPEVEPYLDRVREVTGERVSVSDFCAVAGYSDDTVFGAWRSGNRKKCNDAQAAAFDRVVSLHPEEFIRRIKNP